MTQLISREELVTKIQNRSRLVLVEALPPAHFAQGHLPGAINLPLDGLKRRAGEVLPERDAEIVVYCSGPTCNNSHVAERALRELGYDNVRVFSGGKAAWKDAGLPLEVAK